MTSRLFPLFLLTLVVLAPFWSPPVHAQAVRNPFVPDRRESTLSVNATQPVMLPMPGSILKTVVHWQLELRTRMSGFAKQIKQRPWGRAFWLFMLASLAYGAAHALGPGHGKVFAVSYFLDRPGPLVLGVLFGNLSMFFHVLSAAVLVFAGTFVLETTASGLVQDVGLTLEGVSYAMLLTIGVSLTALRFKGLVRDEDRKERQGQPGRSSLKPLLVTALAAGLVPCPGAALVLLFCISLGLPVAGFLSLVAISAGMGATISAFGVAAIGSCHWLAGLAKGRGRLFRAVQHGVGLFGALAMAVMGGLLLAGWLAS